MPSRLPFDVGGLFLIGQIFLDVPEIEPGRELDPPVVERGADRLGVLEAGDRVTAEAAQPGDRPLAQVEQLFVERQLLVDQLVDFARATRPSTCRRPS